MATNEWPFFRSCKIRVTSANEWTDGLNKLPNEVLLTILSSLTMKEAARTSILSHQWRQLWPYFSGVFNFEYSLSDKAPVKINASNFVSWVNHIVKHHLSPSIEGFKVIYPLDRSYQSRIDTWMIFALTKGAKSLVLELNPICSIAHDFYTLPVECCMSLRSPSNLKTLVLKFVSVTNEVVGCFLQSCPFLEKLCICCSVCLTSVRSCGLGLALKHLEITSCFQLENIDILAPKLVSFKCQGPRIQLHIQNACVLSELSLGVRDTASVVSAFDSLSKYLSQLELLHVKLYMERDLIAPPVATLANVKHMILTIRSQAGQSVIGWVTLIEASPVLHKLSLQFEVAYYYDFMWSYGRRRCGQPLKCLKTLELYGFVGRRIDLELATYVIENAVALEEVLVDLKMYGLNGVINPDKIFSRKRAEKLRKKLRVGVKFVLSE